MIRKRMTKKRLVENKKNFEEFVEQQRKLQQEIPDKLTRPRKGRRVLYKKFDPYLPRERGKKSKLIPISGQFPCDRCAEAQYNRLCSKMHECMCYVYWGITCIDALSRSTIQKE